MKREGKKWMVITYAWKLLGSFAAADCVVRLLDLFEHGVVASCLVWVVFFCKLDVCFLQVLV